MREMKYSGVEWLEENPESWRLSKIKHIAWVDPMCDFSTLDEDTLITYTPMEYIKQGYYIPNSASYGQLSPSLTAYQEGDIVMAKVTPCFENGNIAIMSLLESGKGLGSSELSVFRPRSINTKYLFYWLQNEAFIQQACSTMTGVGGLKRVSPQFIKNCGIHIPTENEQVRIVDYLDAKCAKIDALIAKQQEIIEKLKAYKLSVITEAVTKGLNPNVPMKDSGISWLGEIPSHWEFRRTKSMATIVDCKNRTPENIPDGEYTVVRTTCIKDGKFSYDGSFQTDYNNYVIWTERGAPKTGDVFFTREAPMGEACMVPNTDNLCMGQRVMYFRPFDDVDGRFILYSIYGPLVREYIESKSKGSTVGHLKLGQVADLPMLYCPYDEQVSICDYLDSKCQKIDDAVHKKQKIVDRLTAYKKSIIYEVVTGKREV